MSRRALQLVCLLAATALLVLAGPADAQAQSAEEILSRFSDEPTVLELQAAAMAYAGLDPDTIDSWYTRASAANVLPERLQYRFRLVDRDYDNRRVVDDLTGLIDPVTGQRELIGSEERFEKDEQLFLEHQINVQWNLSELIFNPDVMRVSSEVNRQVRLREDILTSVTKLYYERRQAQVEMVVDPPSDSDPGDRLRRELRIQELTAEIDALTGGWFSSQLRAAGKDPY